MATASLGSAAKLIAKAEKKQKAYSKAFEYSLNTALIQPKYSLNRVSVATASLTSAAKLIYSQRGGKKSRKKSVWSLLRINVSGLH